MATVESTARVEGENDEPVQQRSPELHTFTGEVAHRAIVAAKLGKLGIAERFRISREHIARTQDGLFGAFFRRRPEGNEDEDDQGRHDWAKVAKHYGTFWHLFLTLATSVPSPRRAFELSV